MFWNNYGILQKKITSSDSSRSNTGEIQLTHLNASLGETLMCDRCAKTCCERRNNSLNRTFRLTRAERVGHKGPRNTTVNI